MKYLKFLAIAFSITLFSCKKDKDNTIENTNEPAIIPHIHINVDNEAEVNTKANYLPAEIIIDGKNKYESYEGRTGIRGRGNSSWSFPKKPYKLKLDAKEPLFGMAPYKKWILLAEYLDGSMLYNSIPFKAAEMLGIPYTNNVVPVELTINNEYRGFYVFMEHKEVGPDRIDIGEDGVLLELDAYYDEDWQFKSDKFDLPVMVQYPKSSNMTGNKLIEIRDEFEVFEALVADPSFPNNNYLDYFDDLSFVNYMIIYELTQNREISHPKSTYMNKKKDGKFRMGIIWDFDWGFGYSFNQQHYDLGSVNTPTFADASYPGTDFFTKFMDDPHLQQLFAERWNWFRANKFRDLKRHVKEYAELVRQAMEADHQVWGARNSSGDIDVDLLNALSWLEARANYIDNYISSF